MEVDGVSLLFLLIHDRGYLLGNTIQIGGLCLQVGIVFRVSCWNDHLTILDFCCSNSESKFDIV